jgi:hypothetical protein
MLLCLLEIHVYHASALRDVKIPPGPRLLILDHIKRYGMVYKRKSGFLAFSVPFLDLLLFIHFAEIQS